MTRWVELLFPLWILLLSVDTLVHAHAPVAGRGSRTAERDASCNVLQ